MPVAALAAGVFDEDAAHGLGRGGEEVAPAVPLRRVRWSDQPQVGLVDQGGGLEGLARLLPGDPRRCELPKLVVDERQQLGRGRVQQLGDSGHDR
jgi:hypothetical protein